MTASEVAAALEELREKLDVSFVLQTLEYLHKGGRCSGVAAFGANLMKLRPEIEVVDGKMQVGRKYRGTMEKTVLSYIRGRLEGRDDIRTDRIFITHSGVPQDIEDKAVALVKELHPFKEVIVTKAGCTISSHCGPNCLGVLFLKK
jgi:DegV family protein with EDD domain